MTFPLLLCYQYMSTIRTGQAIDTLLAALVGAILEAQLIKIFLLKFATLTYITSAYLTYLYIWQMEQLSTYELYDLICKKQKLLNPEDPWLTSPQNESGEDQDAMEQDSEVTEQFRRSFLIEIFVQAYERKPDVADLVNNIPLYPTEKVLFDEN